MPKKFKGGENSKAVEARARKAAAKAEQESAKQKAVEDAYWADDDKHNQRKQQRKEDKEKKRLEQLERKKEQEALLAEEMAQLKSSKPAPSAKVTRAEIEANRQSLAAGAQGSKTPKKKALDSDDEADIEQNLNRLSVDGAEARTVNEAISVLGSKGEPETDMHPEKRMKAAYRAYEERQLPLLKAEYGNMRLSQLKQMLKKDWMKSEENPMVQFQMAQLKKS